MWMIKLWLGYVLDLFFLFRFVDIFVCFIKEFLWIESVIKIVIDK